MNAQEAYELWCQDHHSLSIMQGWVIFEGAARFSIERVDEAEEGHTQLDSDIAAWRYVLDNAEKCKTCWAALQFLAEHEPRELLFMADGYGASSRTQVLLVTASLTCDRR